MLYKSPMACHTKDTQQDDDNDLQAEVECLKQENKNLWRYVNLSTADERFNVGKAAPLLPRDASLTPSLAPEVDDLRTKLAKAEAVNAGKQNAIDVMDEEIIAAINVCKSQAQIIQSIAEHAHTILNENSKMMDPHQRLVVYRTALQRIATLASDRPAQMDWQVSNAHSPHRQILQATQPGLLEGSKLLFSTGRPESTVAPQSLPTQTIARPTRQEDLHPTPTSKHTRAQHRRKPRNCPAGHRGKPDAASKTQPWIAARQGDVSNVVAALPPKLPMPNIGRSAKDAVLTQAQLQEEEEEDEKFLQWVLGMSNSPYSKEQPEPGPVNNQPKNSAGDIPQASTTTASAELKPSLSIMTEGLTVDDDQLYDISDEETSKSRKARDKRSKRVKVEVKSDASDAEDAGNSELGGQPETKRRRLG